MKSLVIAEKPSVARDIARVLHCNQKGNGTLEGKDYVVTWALGHLVTLADPEEYDKKYTKWELATLPMMPEKMKLVVIRQTSKQYQAVKTQLFRKDIGDIIIATDAGREGELVARWILDKAGCRKPIRRIPAEPEILKSTFSFGNCSATSRSISTDFSTMRER